MTHRYNDNSEGVPPQMNDPEGTASLSSGAGMSASPLLISASGMPATLSSGKAAVKLSGLSCGAEAVGGATRRKSNEAIMTLVWFLRIAVGHFAPFLHT